MAYKDNHPSVNKQFGQFLKQARVSAGFTQCHVSKELGFKNGQYLSNLERGLCSAPFKVLGFFVKKYGIDVRDFIQYLMALEKHNLELKFGLIKKPERIKIPFFLTEDMEIRVRKNL